MTLNDKNDCIESIIKILERTSAWRRAIAHKFPSDARNMRAADTLERLASQAVTMTDEQWDAFSPHYSWSSQQWRDSVNHVARGVAFHYRSADFKFFAKALAEQLSFSESATA